MKRFYRLVSTQSLPTGVRICLDNKPLRTPRGDDLLAPNEALAALVQQEWAVQGDVIDRALCPVTALLNTAQDSRPEDRTAWIQTIDRTLDTDLLAYPADHPPALVAYEQTCRDPLRVRFHALTGHALALSDSLVVQRQSDLLHGWVRSLMARLDPLRLTLCVEATRDSGSSVLALLLLTGNITCAEWMRAIFSEEDFYHERPSLQAYGLDPESERKRQRLEASFVTIESILGTLGAFDYAR